MNFKYYYIIFLGFLFIFSQCQKQKPEKRELKSLKFAISSSFNGNFHPVEDSSLISFQPLLRSIHSTLFKLDSNSKPFPFFIKKYDINGKIVTFYLKKNLKFSDGTDITSDDVVWSIESGLKYRINPNPVYKLIEGGEEFFKGKTKHCSGIKVLNQRSFVVEFKKRNCEFPYYFTSLNLSILPKNWTRDRMIFSGAFKLVKEDVKKNITTVLLEKNPYYIGKEPLLDSILFIFYTPMSEFEKAIERGEPDMFIDNFNNKLPKSDYKYNYFKTPLAGNFLFLLNPQKGVFKNKQLRTAFKNYLLTFDFIEKENWDYVSRATHVLPYGLDGYFLFESFKKRNFDGLRQKSEIRIRCFYRDAGIRKTIFPYLKKKLKKYNLNLELYQETWDELIPRMRNGNFDLTAFYYMPEIPNSFYFYESLLTYSVDINPMGFEIPEAINLLTAYREEAHEFKKMKILSRLEEIAQEESFVIPIANILSLIGYKDFIKNVKNDQFLNISLEEIDVEKGN